MRLRRSVKRMHLENWRPWQHEEYLGVHARIEFIPADDADPRGYQFRPCFIVQSPPVDQRRYPTRQVTMMMSEQPRTSIWQRIKKRATV